MKTVILALISLLLFLYVTVFIYFVVTQESQIYLVPNRNNDCEDIARLTEVREGNTVLYHYDNPTSDSVVVFYHGNASIVCDMLFLANIFDEMGVSYIFPEYTGYSDKGTKTSHVSVLSNAEDVVSFVEKRKYKEVYVIGQSIGTGPATYHSSFGQLDNLLLISPFTKISDITTGSLSIYPSVLVRMFTDDTLNNQKNLSQYKGGLTILHGGEDRVIPHKLGERLFNSTQMHNKERITLDGYGHNGIYQSPVAMQTIRDFIRK